MLRTVAIITSAFAIMSPAAFAESCKVPAGPDMSAPGANLSVEAFNEITAGLTTFDADLQTYRTCLDNVIHAPQDHTREEWDEALAAYNNISTAQAELYERYDLVSKDFQTAQANRATTAANEDKENSANNIQAQLAAELAVMNQ